MKKLTLRDGTELSVFDSSSDKEIVLKLKKRGDFEAAKKQVTTESIQGAALGDEVLSGLSVMGSFLAEGDGGFLTAHFALGRKSEAEQRIADLEEALASIAGGEE